MKKKDVDIKKYFSKAFENHKNNNFEDAEKYYNRVLELNPTHFESLFYIASLFAQKKFFLRAKEFFERAIKVRPSYDVAYSNLGAVLKELGKFEESVDACKKAIKIKSKNHIAYSNLGAVLRELGKYRESIIACEKALQISPNNIDAYHNLGLAFQESNEIAKAIICYEELIKINLKNVNAYQNLGKLKTMIGETKEAIKYYNLARKIEPENLLNQYNLIELDKTYLNKDYENELNLTMQNNQLNKKNLAYGYFIKSKYEIKNRNYKKEFEYLIKGHNYYLSSEELKYNNDINYWLNVLPKKSELFDTKLIKTKILSSLDKVNPIFVIGTPRCGSTLVEKIIASGPEHISIGEETGVFSSFIKKKIINNKSIYDEIESAPQIILDKYIEKNILKENKISFFTDKTLDNFFYINFIKKIFPKAKFINCKRAPIASIISILKNNLPQVSWAHDLNNIFNYFNIYHQKIEKFKNFFPDVIYDLNFENLANNPEEESKNIMKFCNLTWSSNCLKFYERKDLISKTTSNIQIRQEIYKHSLEKYIPYKEFLNNYGKKFNWFK